MRDVLLIPGVGGHPAFHRLLIEGLSRQFRVHTSAHGDFFTEPFDGLGPHVDYWAARARELPERPDRVVAVSFGVHVVPGLVRRLDDWPARLVLVSPWIPDTLVRAGLGVLSSAPRRPMSRWLARRLMGWTDRCHQHAQEIARLRADLYDDPDRVAERWRARTLAIAGSGALSWSWLAEAATNSRVTVVFGRDEWLYRMQRWRAAASARRGVDVIAVDGGHDVGTFATPGMIVAVTDALQ